MQAQPYSRLYADRDGESHFEDGELPLSAVDFAPPAPPLCLSELRPAARFALFGMPAGWVGDFHPAPRRQFFFILSGRIDVRASDGELRRFPAGSVLLMEDTTGRGHASWSVGGDALAAVVQLPEQAPAPA